MTTERADSNPNMDDTDMDHWRCKLRRAGPPSARMTIYFSMGFGLKGAEPTLAEVLDCLASDAAGVENAQGFEDWAGEYGYDSDSRKAERTFRVCEKQAERLKQFIGDDATYQALLFDCERE
jgi:hypothetical protein